MGATIYDPAYRRLVAILRGARIAAGISQGELGRRLGRRQTYVSKYELAERHLDLIELRQICDALGVDLVEVVRMFVDPAEDG